MVEPYVTKIMLQSITGQFMHNLDVVFSHYISKQEGMLTLGIHKRVITVNWMWQRVCHIYKSNNVEDEQHFLLVCEAYREERNMLFEQCSTAHELNVS